jgi:hypothetical protein
MVVVLFSFTVPSVGVGMDGLLLFLGFHIYTLQPLYLLGIFEIFQFGKMKNWGGCFLALVMVFYDDGGFLCLYSCFSLVTKSL